MDPNFKYDPVNVGTYNYSAYDFEYVTIDGNVKETSEDLHNKYDVYPYLGDKEEYNNWGNVPGLIYGNSKDDRNQNGKHYDKYANKHVYEDYWKGLFE